MKLSKIIAVSACLLTAACVSMPRETEQRSAQVAQRYHAIKNGMARQEVVAALGVPQGAGAQGHLRWEERYGGDGYDALEVGFDNSEKVNFVATKERRRMVFLGHSYASTSIAITGAGEAFDYKRDDRVAAEAKASQGVPAIYHDYDYGWNGSVGPYQGLKKP